MCIYVHPLIVKTVLKLQKCLKGTTYAHFQLILTVCEGGTSPQFTDAALACLTQLSSNWLPITYAI